MKLLRWSHGPGGKDRAALLFGGGLIGSRIEHAILKCALMQSDTLPFVWEDEATWSAQLTSIESAALSARTSETESDPAAVDIVWAGGTSGFGSATETVTRETNLVEAVLAFADGFAARHPGTQVSFHYVSSAGGLFEGLTHCGPDTSPRPLRPYGQAKLAQEEAVRAASSLARCCIYRPSSVYGYSPGGRRGLITALIANALTSQTTRIVGNPNTIRDYVLASDVGAFIAGEVVSMPAPGGRTYLLANGRPMSVFEVIQRVRQVVPVPLLLQYDPHPDNARDMSFSPSALPKTWQPTDCETGIRLTASRIQQDLLLRA